MAPHLDLESGSLFQFSAVLQAIEHLRNISWRLKQLHHGGGHHHSDLAQYHHFIDLYALVKPLVQTSVANQSPQKDQSRNLAVVGGHMNVTSPMTVDLSVPINMMETFTKLKQLTVHQPFEVGNPANGRVWRLKGLETQEL